MMIFPHRQHESWAVIRRRMIHETEAFIEDGLRHPKNWMIIPAVPVGKANFKRIAADLF